MVMVCVSMSRQIGQVNSLCSDFGLTAISVIRFHKAREVIEKEKNEGHNNNNMSYLIKPLAGACRGLDKFLTTPLTVRK